MKKFFLATALALSASMIAFPASASSDQRPLSLLIVNSSDTPIQIKSVTIGGTACANCVATVKPHSAWVHAVGNKTAAFSATIATPSGNSATMKVDDGASMMGGLNDPAVVAHSDSVDAYMGSFDPKNLGTYRAIFIANK